MRDSTARRKWLEIAIVATIALVIRAIYLNQFSSLPDWSRLSVDNWYHHNWATAIANGNLWGDTTYFRAPLYAWCLGALYYVFSPSILVARLFGLVIGVTSVILTHRIADNIAGRRTALIASLIQAVYPVLIMTESELLLDPLFMLLVQGLILGVLYWARHRTTNAIFLCSFIAGLAVITRPTLLVLLPLLFGILLWQIRQSRKQLLGQLFAVLLGLSLTVGIVFARNMTVADDPVLVASQGGINFFIGNNDAADGLHAVMPEPLGYNWRIADITYLAEQSAGRQLKPGEISSYWAGAAWEWIVHHPMKFGTLTLKRLWYSFADIEVDNNRDQSALRHLIPLVKYNPIGFGIVFILAVVGAAALWGNSRAVRWLVFGALALTLVNALFFVNSRFRLPMIPVCFVLAGAALDEITRRGRLIYRSFGLALIALVAGVVTFSPGWLPPTKATPQDDLSKGLAFYNGGDYNAALAEYRSAFVLDSAFPDVNANIGATYLRLGQTDSARSYFQREMAQHPRRSLAFANAAALALVQGQYEAAGKLALESIHRKPYDPTGWLVLIRASAGMSGLSPDSLRTVCVRACNTARNSLDVCFEAGAVLDAVGDDEAAIELFGRAAESRPLPIETDDRMFTSGYWSAIAKDRRQRARAQMSLGAIYGRRGEFAQAASHSSAAIEVDSSLAGAWVNLIAAKVQLGLESQAGTLLQKAVARFPDDPLIISLNARLNP